MSPKLCTRRSLHSSRKRLTRWYLSLCVEFWSSLIISLSTFLNLCLPASGEEAIVNHAARQKKESLLLSLLLFLLGLLPLLRKKKKKENTVCPAASFPFSESRERIIIWRAQNEANRITKAENVPLQSETSMQMFSPWRINILVPCRSRGKNGQSFFLCKIYPSN